MSAIDWLIDHIGSHQGTLPVPPRFLHKCMNSLQIMRCSEIEKSCIRNTVSSKRHLFSSLKMAQRLNQFGRIAFLWFLCLEILSKFKLIYNNSVSFTDHRHSTLSASFECGGSLFIDSRCNQPVINRSSQI